MNERRANIDLAFRNGLKDYEVLPPPDVWNSIDARIRVRKKPVYFIRAAAFIAIAMTFGLLASRWLGKTSNIPDNSVIAINEESKSPAGRDNLSIPVSQTKKISGIGRHFINTTLNTTPQISPVTQGESVAAGEVSNIVNLPEADLLSPFNPASLSIVHRQHSYSGQLQSTLATENVYLEYPDQLPDNNIVNNTRHWSIAALATPTYYGTISSGSNELSKQIMASEQSVVSYTGGVALAYEVSKRFSIQSGLFYSSVGQELDGINSFAGFQKYGNTKGDHNFEVLTSNGTIYTNNDDVFLLDNGNSNRIITNYNNNVFDPQKASLDYINNSMRQSFSYLELPVFLRYKVIDKTIDFNLIGGLSYNLLIDNSVYTVIEGSKYMIGTTEGLNTFSVSSSLGMGMEYNFSKKLSLNLEPTFRYYLNTFNNVNGSNFHPYSFGIFSGISYKF
jgi:hypothetical protein